MLFKVDRQSQDYNKLTRLQQPPLAQADKLNKLTWYGYTMLTAAAAWMMKSICYEVICQVKAEHKVSVMEPEITKNALDKQCILATRWTCFTVHAVKL